MILWQVIKRVNLVNKSKWQSLKLYKWLVKWLSHSSHRMALKARKVSDEESSSQNQLEKVLSHYIRICVFFLSAPVTISRSKWSKFNAGVHIIWSLLVILVITWASYEEYVNVNSTVPDVEQFLHLTEYAVNIVTVLATPWVSYRRRRFYRRASDQVQTIDKELSQIVGSLSYKAFIKFFNIYLILLMVFIGATSSIIFCFEHFRFVGFLRGCAVYLIPNLVNSFQLGQYYCVLLFIRERMRSIIAFTEKLNFKTKDSSENMTALRIVFSKLEYLHFKVNENASVITGITFTSGFLIISNQLFVFYNDIADSNINEWDLSLFSLIWLCLHFGKVLCLYYFNSQIINARSSLAEVLSHHEHVTSDEHSVSFRLWVVSHILTSIHCRSQDSVFRWWWIGSHILAISLNWICRISNWYDCFDSTVYENKF